MLARLGPRFCRQAERRLHPPFIYGPSLQFVGLGCPLQFAHLVHHHLPDHMAGMVARKPGPLRPECDIKFCLVPVQLDQMLCDKPKIFFVHGLPIALRRWRTNG